MTLLADTDSAFEPLNGKDHEALDRWLVQDAGVAIARTPGSALHLTLSTLLGTQEMLGATDRTLIARIAAALLLALFLAAPGAAHAIPVNVVNGGFEDPVLSHPDEGTVYGPPAGWTGSGTIGVWRPDVAQFPGGPEGANVGFVHDATSGMAQILEATLTAGTTYTLQVDVGNRLDWPVTVYSFGLYAGGALLVQDVNTSIPAPGQFGTRTLFYTPTVADLQLGQALEIRLGTPGWGAYYDDVRLDASSVVPAVPEPHSALLLAAGLVGLALCGRRARR